MPVTVIDHPLIQHKLAVMRDAETNVRDFRALCTEVSMLMAFEAMRETLERTSLAGLRAGARVNLERAMRADARLDGHIVQGHVDATGKVVRLERAGDDVRLFVDCPPEFAELLVEKGSVAIDGVSLTVVGVRPDGFDVALIPHTLAVTTWGERRAGDVVNIEIDTIARYVARLAAFRTAA